MDSKKFLIGGIIGGIANFLLGWLVWGILLMNFMRTHSNPTAAVIFRSETDIAWGALIVGNFSLGFMITYILMKANIKTATAAAATGFIVALLTSLGIDCIMYAQMKIYGTTAMAVDVLAAAVVTGIVAAVVGWFLGRGEKAS